MQCLLLGSAGGTWLKVGDLLGPADATRADTPDGNTALVIVIVQVGHQHLQRGVQLDRGGFDLLHNGLKEGLQVTCKAVGESACCAVDSGGIDCWEVTLLI